MGSSRPTILFQEVTLQRKRSKESDNESFLFFHERYSSPFARALLHLGVMIFFFAAIFQSCGENLFEQAYHGSLYPKDEGLSLLVVLLNIAPFLL